MEILKLVSREQPLDCVATVVLYRNPLSMINNVVDSVLNTNLNIKLYIIDNAPEPLQSPIFKHRSVFYHHVGENLGYGKAHNWCIRRCEPSRYYLILNPDVVFSAGVLEELIQYLDTHPDVGTVCPLVLNEDQTVQHLNKREPNLLDLFLRRFYFLAVGSSLRRRLDRYVMKDIGYDHICEVPFMTGAFMLCRMETLKRVGGFDPRYFMYFEDADLSKKIRLEGAKTIFYPYVSITHLWQRASRTRIKMTIIFILSGIKYFHKWGWKLY